LLDTVLLWLLHPTPAVNAASKYKGDIYMVFDYAKYDLSAILKKVETKEMVLSEQQVGAAEPRGCRAAVVMMRAAGGWQQVVIYAASPATGGFHHFTHALPRMLATCGC
jgi:hypothetical protein